MRGLSSITAEKLYDTVNDLCRNFRPGNLIKAMEDLRGALGSASRMAEEDDFMDEDKASLAEGMKRQFHIPAWALAEAFGKPWKQLRNYLDNLSEQDAWKWNRHFCKSAFLLNLVINREQRLVDESLIEIKKGEKRYRATVPPEALRRFSWRYDFGNEQVFYYIPLRYLPSLPFNHQFCRLTQFCHLTIRENDS